MCRLTAKCLNLDETRSVAVLKWTKFVSMQACLHASNCKQYIEKSANDDLG